jgi:hypothetical protein
MTDRLTLAEEVRRGYERAQEHMARLEKRFDAVDAEPISPPAPRGRTFTPSLERISTGERAASMVTRQVSEDAARAYAQDAIRQSPDAGDLWVVAVEARS